jgi:hypothetical protein
LILEADDAERSCICVIRKTELTLGLAGFRRPNIYSIFVLQKNASIQSSLLDLFAPMRKALTRVAYRAAAHVPLPEITMSNSAVGDDFHV